MEFNLMSKLKDDPSIQSNAISLAVKLVELRDFVLDSITYKKFDKEGKKRFDKIRGYDPYQFPDLGKYLSEYSVQGKFGLLVMEGSEYYPTAARIEREIYKACFDLLNQEKPDDLIIFLGESYITCLRDMLLYFGPFTKNPSLDVFINKVILLLEDLHIYEDCPELRVYNLLHFFIDLSPEREAVKTVSRRLGVNPNKLVNQLVEGIDDNGEPILTFDYDKNPRKKNYEGGVN